MKRVTSSGHESLAVQRFSGHRLEPLTTPGKGKASLCEYLASFPGSSGGDRE